MSFKLGLVGLCTSHPARWLPLIRELGDEPPIKVVAAWDSAEVRPEGYAREFCRQHDIPLAANTLNQMQDAVDGVIVHTANWDRHVDQARVFVEANQGVLIDKPLVGSYADAQQLKLWADSGKRITGGSSLRYAPEILRLNELPLDERGNFHTVLACCGTDRFFYGIHGFAMLSGLLGPGLRSVQSVSEPESALVDAFPFSVLHISPAERSVRRDNGDVSDSACQRSLVKLTWNDGRIAILCQMEPVRWPLQFIAFSNRNVYQFQVDMKNVYREFLRRNLLFLTGRLQTPPTPLDALLESERAAIATLFSRSHGGVEVALDHAELGSTRYDGHEFAARYRAAQASAPLK